MVEFVLDIKIKEFFLEIIEYRVKVVCCYKLEYGCGVFVLIIVSLRMWVSLI